MSAEFWNVDDATYYGDSKNSVSNSDCDLYLQSPELYHAVVNLGLPWQREKTAAMELGTAIHAAVLGTAIVKQVPDSALTSNGQRRGKAWEEFEQEIQPGELYVSQSEMLVIREILINIKASSVLSNLIWKVREGNRTEQAIRWTCSETGLVRRCKVDLLLPNAIVDIKTFGRQLSAQSFATRVEEGGYYRQQAFYQDAVEALGMGRLPFVFVVIQTEPPYSVRCFDLAKSWSERGRVEVLTMLRSIRNARESGIWKTDGADEILTIDAPRWAVTKQEWSL